MYDGPVTMRVLVIAACCLLPPSHSRDEEKIMKACYWPNEVYEPCFGGCAEVSCDNPRNHLRPCYPYCEPGCVCEDPYVRDDRTHQCVLPQDCSPTQMGIPVPSRRGNDKPTKYERSPRSPWQHKRSEDMPNENDEMQPPPPAQQIPPSHSEDFKRSPEVSRMGNYFNIVIAPPPIKALQPRKLLQNDVYRAPQKRRSE
ncbi:trypsin inhibitor like cysteine rich domain-containing protein [Phthorimaea operculella]|nr:trypsin inhibitor like cysteine rich domain-containing protein [Phthorimaea operculella]